MLSALVNYTLRSLTKPFSSLCVLCVLCAFARKIAEEPAPKAPTKYLFFILLLQLRQHFHPRKPTPAYSVWTSRGAGGRHYS